MGVGSVNTANVVDPSLYVASLLLYKQSSNSMGWADAKASKGLFPRPEGFAKDSKKRLMTVVKSKLDPLVITRLYLIVLSASQPRA